MLISTFPFRIHFAANALVVAFGQTSVCACVCVCLLHFDPGIIFNSVARFTLRFFLCSLLFSSCLFFFSAVAICKSSACVVTFFVVTVAAAACPAESQQAKHKSS